MIFLSLGLFYYIFFMPLECSISFDVERDPPAANRGETSFKGVESIPGILDVLDRNGVRATFFVTGRVAKEYPATLAEIVSRGHEVGVHGGYNHEDRIKGLSTEEQLERIMMTADLIEKAAGKAPVGYRAPGHLIDISTMSALEEMGFLYDSSLVPGAGGYILYDQAYSTPNHPYHPGSMAILEIPTTPVMIDGNLDSLLAYQGGEMTKLELFLAALTCKIQGKPLVLYLHPGHMTDLPNEPADYKAGRYILTGFDATLTFLEGVFNIRYVTLGDMAKTH